MRQTLKIITFVTFGYALGWAGSVWRYGLPAWGRHHGPPRPGAMFDELGLSSEQSAQIQTIREGRKQKFEAWEEKLQSARRSFEETLDGSKDIPLLREKFAAMSQIKDEMEKEHFESMLAIHQVLTLEQIKELGAKRPKGPRHGGPFGRGPFDGPPPGGPHHGPPPF